MGLRLKLVTGLIAFALSVPAVAQTPPTVPSPVLPPPFATPSQTNNPKPTPLPIGSLPTVPDGFVVTRFAAGLDSPRNAIVLPNGDVLVAEAKTERKYDDPQYRAKGANRIALLRDRDGDGVAEFRSLLLEGLRQPYGMALIGKRLYIADTDGVYWVPFTPGTTTLPSSIRKTRITSFLPGGYNNHWTRNLIASRDGKSLYIAVGSASNAGEFGVEAENRRAAILHIDLRTGKETVFASGLRNPVGMAFAPDTDTLWTSVNERDELGDDLVPDYITSVRRGAFYGWPYSYYGQNEDPRRKGERPDLVASAIAPDFAVGPHASALGLAFGATTRFPAHYRNGVFVARHGSWNRSTLFGYDVVFVPFKDGRPAGAIEPFLGGFIGGPSKIDGRPRALAIARDGSMLVVDDAGGSVWRVAAR